MHSLPFGEFLRRAFHVVCQLDILEGKTLWVVGCQGDLHLVVSICPSGMMIELLRPQSTLSHKSLQGSARRKLHPTNHGSWKPVEIKGFGNGMVTVA